MIYQVGCKFLNIAHYSLLLQYKSITNLLTCPANIMGSVCITCQAIPDPASTDWKIHQLWPDSNDLHRSAENGCPLCRLFLQQKQAERPDPYSDVSPKQKKLLEINSVCICRQCSNPDPWLVLQIRTGRSDILGEVVVFSPGTLRFFPSLKLKSFRVKPFNNPDESMATAKRISHVTRLVTIENAPGHNQDTYLDTRKHYQELFST